jgi:uncharacterized membrane protein YgdD (TMEM256/DUF423 family)
MHRSFLFIGALFGGLAVALGALGAHGLQQMTNDEKILHAFQTAVQYQVYHALGLILLSLIYEKIPGSLISWAAYLFIGGIILFSGSIYALTAIRISGKTGFDGVGIITPIGGLFFIAGWLLILLAAFRTEKSWK